MPVLDCMLDVPIFVEQHAKICEGLTTLQLLPSNCPCTSVMATAKDHNLSLGNADGQATGQV